MTMRYFKSSAAKKGFCILTLIFLCIMSGCNNINPQISNNKTDSTVSYNEASTQSKEIPTYINADELAHRSYELRYLLAQEKFNSPEEISVNALVQYAFCHLFYDNLTDMPKSGNRVRQATAEEINQRIIRDFGEIDTDITKSDLYNAGKNIFEMWEPAYGTDIFYAVTLIREESGLYKARTTFYNDSSKNEIIGKTVLTVRDNAGQMIITKMTSSK